MLREALGRRGLFKRLGVGALLASSGQENIARLANIGVDPGAILGGGVPVSMPSASRIFRQASDFSTWWKEYARSQNSHDYISSIDPDIAGFRLPLSTKVRMQRDRNYDKAKARAKIQFLSRLLFDGKVEVYGDGRNKGHGGQSPATAVGPSRSLG